MCVCGGGGAEGEKNQSGWWARATCVNARGGTTHEEPANGGKSEPWESGPCTGGFVSGPSPHPGGCTYLPLRGRQFMGSLALRETSRDQVGTGSGQVGTRSGKKGSSPAPTPESKVRWAWLYSLPFVSSLLF